MIFCVTSLLIWLMVLTIHETGRLVHVPAAGLSRLFPGTELTFVTTGGSMIDLYAERSP